MFMRPTGGAHTNLLSGHISKNTAAGANNSVGPDLDTGSNKTVRGYPGTVLNQNRRCYLGKTRVANIVATSSQIRFLRDYTVLTLSNRHQTIKGHIFSYPAEVANFHIPGIGKSRRGANHDIFTNFGTEQPE